MKRILTLSLLGFLSSVSFATNITSALNTIINRVDPNINMGMLVIDLDSGETLYQRNANRAFIPASNMKLFSDALALMIFGPDYRFQSQLSTDAPLVEQGILKGSVYLHLPGDPSLSQHHIKSLLTQLRHWGITRIEGNVVLASDHSAASPYAPGLDKRDFKFSYGAPVAPIVLDQNRVKVTVNPAYRVGAPALIELSPKNSALIVDNQVKTAANSRGCGIDYLMGDNNHLTVRGCVGIGQWAIQQGLAIRNPLSYAQGSVKKLLSSLHIQLDGHVTLGNAPKNALLISTHRSKSIAALMADTLKPSDNLYADSLFLNAAAKLRGKPVTWAEAQETLKGFLRHETGINLDNAALVDGSGLSRHDLVTPEQTVALLRFLHNRFPLAYEYIAALPIAGYDGSLQRRLKKPSQQGLVRAKTGTMTGVLGLSGYLYTQNAHTLAFAIFINTRPKTSPSISGRYRSLLDTLCDFLLRQTPGNTKIASENNAHKRIAFQQQPTQADQIRGHYAKWRRLEYTLKHALEHQAVTVVFRGDQLVLIDHNATADGVWTALQTARKKHTFAVALQSNVSPQQKGSEPRLLWIKSQKNAVRTWTLRDITG